MAEKLGFEKCFRDRSAIDFHERAVFPEAVEMDGSCNHFFPCSGLAGYQNRCLRRRNLDHGFDESRHGRTMPDQVLTVKLTGKTFPEVAVFLF